MRYNREENTIWIPEEKELFECRAPLTAERENDQNLMASHSEWVFESVFKNANKNIYLAKMRTLIYYYMTASYAITEKASPAVCKIASKVPQKKQWRV